MTWWAAHRPGCSPVPDAARAGDTLVVTKLDRLARSIRDAHDIADELAAKGVVLAIGNSAYDPDDPFGKLMFSTLAMIAEFERANIRFSGLAAR